jgi:hypothetical protein
LRRLFETNAYFNEKDTNRTYSITWTKKGEDMMSPPKDFSIKQGENSFNINSLFPSGCKFILGDEPSYNQKTNIVTVQQSHWDSRMFLPDFLHEIGHAHQEEQLNSAPIKMGIINAGLSIFNTLRDNKSVSEVTWSKIFDKEFKDLLPAEKFYYYPRGLREKIQSQSAWAERGAWAYALRQIRHLKTKGIDISSSWEGDSGKIRDLITYCLLSYDYRRVLKRPDLLKEQSPHLKNRMKNQ